jgi:Tol biopolymer transport system component
MLLLAGIGLLLLCLGAAAGPAAAQAQERCFAETGYCIAGRIRDYWEQNDGLRVFGLPISPQEETVIEGKPVEAQWFERNRLELHPTNASPFDVLLGRLGSELVVEQQISPMTETARPDCQFFPETQLNVCADFLRAWQAYGLEFGDPGVTDAESLALFGLPITPEMQARLSDGNTYTVQYFERARFEYHPDNEPPYDVLFGLLGHERQAGNTTAPAVPQGQLAFVSDRTGNQEVYVMQADGSGLVNLTSHPADDTQPVWSPDGSRLAFVSNRDGEASVYVMQADGSQPTRLLAQPASSPAWSPDGSRLALLIRDGEPPHPDFFTSIATVQVDGSGLRVVTDFAGAVFPDALAWSPDGSQFACSAISEAGGFAGQNIYRISSDGSDLVQLTDSDTNLRQNRQPAWSPDGTRIAYSQMRGSRPQTAHLRIVQADGSSDVELAIDGFRNEHPTWLPDGTRLLFQRTIITYNPDTGQTTDISDSDLFLVNADGSNLTLLTHNAVAEEDPAWRP